MIGVFYFSVKKKNDTKWNQDSNISDPTLTCMNHIRMNMILNSITKYAFPIKINSQTMRTTEGNLTIQDIKSHNTLSRNITSTK